MTRREMFGSPEAIVAMAVTAVVCVGSTLGVSWIGMVMVLVIGLALTWITIDTGGHSMLVFSGGFLLLPIGLAIQRLELDGAVPWAVAGLVVLAYADAVRLCFAARRRGVIEPAVYTGVVQGFGLVAISTVVVAVVLAALSERAANASWLVVPLALLLAVIGLVGLAIAVSRSPGEHDKRRWQPGERLMPPPRAASDDPSLRTSSPSTHPTPPARSSPPPPLPPVR